MGGYNKKKAPPVSPRSTKNCKSSPPSIPPRRPTLYHPLCHLATGLLGRPLATLRPLEAALHQPQAASRVQVYPRQLRGRNRSTCPSHKKILCTFVAATPAV